MRRKRGRSKVCLHCSPARVVRRVIASALRTHGTVRAAAKSLGVPTATFHDKAVALLGPLGRRRR